MKTANLINNILLFNKQYVKRWDARYLLKCTRHSNVIFFLMDLSAVNME